MNVFNKSEKEILYNVILKINDFSPIPPSPEEATTNIEELWNSFFLESLDKKISGDNAYKESIYIKLIALRYFLFTLTFSKNESYFLLLQSLTAQISNTIIAVLKLANDGLDFQALSLTRNLMELYMILMVIIESPEKCIDFQKAIDTENARKVWHKYFNKKHFLQMIESCANYDSNVKEYCKEWVNKTYAELSSFAHNDFLKALCFSYAIGNNDVHPINLWGEYVSRKEYIYKNLIMVIGPADTLITAMLNDNKIDVNIRKQFYNINDPMLGEFSSIHKLISDICRIILLNILGVLKNSELPQKTLLNIKMIKLKLKKLFRHNLKQKSTKQNN
ncbi:MAG: hypothetical protein IKL18_08175 [Oscillospiraceae bacterium]|nr:hypothetical protein [Oscillospiraceae bacterium]